MRNQRTMKITMSGLLIAIGIVIPMFSPARLILEPAASYTLASHVAIFIAMFISPTVAVAVAVGTTLGFLFAGAFPIVVVLRAGTHIIYALAGALYLQKMSREKLSAVHLRIFSFCVAVIHAAAEFIIVTIFFFGGNLSALHYERGFLMSVLLLVGLGSVIHSMIDFEIAYIILFPLRKQRHLAGYFAKS